MRKDVEEMRNTYKRVAALDQCGIDDGRYCVGGAFIAYAIGLSDDRISDMDFNTRFPDSEKLAPFILDFNPSLDEDKAKEYARMISDANDERWFDLAWALLDKAISFKQGI